MGKFAEKVKRGKVTGPRKRTFTLHAWKEAFDKFSSEENTEIALYASGRYIHLKLEAIRKVIAQSSLSRLSTETCVKAFVAAANHQFSALERQLQDRAADVAASENGLREVHVRELATTQVRLADGNSYNADSALSCLLDGIAIPIKAALMVPPIVTDDSLANVQWGEVAIEINLGIFYDQAESLWEDCIWNTYIVGGADNNMLALPLDIDAKRGFHASGARKMALAVEATSYAAQALKQAEAIGLISRIREVQDVITNGDQQRIKLGTNKIDTQSQIMLFALITMAFQPYYDSLIHEPQPLLAGHSLSRLFDGWMVVSHAARCLYEATSPARRLDDRCDPNAPSDMREHVPFFTKEALVAAVHEATAIPVAGAQAIIDFLTFRGKDKQQFWTQPLVSTGNPSKLYPIFGALVAPPNLRYVLECWMAQLNVKLEDRGPAFEEHLRNGLSDAASTSPMLLKIAKVVPRDYTFRCAERFVQIDALFCIGSQVFVVEAKCILEPTGSTSIGTHRAAIEHAVVQAKTRVTLIEEHRSEFIADMKQFDWDLPLEFHVHPLVAVNTVAHVGVPLNGVAIVDELVLDKFFQGGYDDVGLDCGDFSVLQRIHRPFYSNAAEAEARAALYFEHPPQLAQYIDALQLREVPMHAVTKHDWSGSMLDFEQIS